MKTNISKNFKRSLTAVAVTLSLGTAVPVMAASNTTGSIYGQAKAGAIVTFKSQETGHSKSITVGANGKFNFRDVPPGQYTVTSTHGGKRQVSVVIGTGSSVLFTTEYIETIDVIGSIISVIDTSSAESTSVFTHEQIELLPVGRDTTAIALLTPGTSAGDPTFGNLASFGGSSVAENGFYIDGFDVTNVRSFLSFASLPFDAVAQTQVKTGGYGAEYGRSLGGVVNTVTKSGTNEWEFGGAAYYTPQSWKDIRENINDRDPDKEGELTSYTADDTRDNLTYNFSIGGPLIEDTLFMFANIEFQDDERHDYKRVESNSRSVTNPNGIVKLDWYITDNHKLSGTYIQTETNIDRVFYQNPKDSKDIAIPYTGAHGTESARYTEENGGNIFIVNYNGQLTDELTMSLMYGQLEDKNGNRIPRNIDPEAVNCPVAIDTTGDKNWGTRINIGCWNTAQSNRIDLEPESARDERKSYKIDFDYIIGDHNIRFGYNNEEYTSYTLGNQWSGGVYYRYFESHASTDTRINGVEQPIGQQAVRVRKKDIKSGSFKVENTALYIEDTWQVSDNWNIYLGLRQETFTNYAANGEVFVEADNLIAPRLGFSWDVDGDSTSKVYGTLGRYYIPIAGNTNVRATRIESSSEFFYKVDGFDPVSGEPINQGEQIGTGFTDVQIPDPRVIAVTDLKPMHQDELILGYQTELYDEWTAGVKFIYRKIQDGMDDMCAHDGFYNWGVDQGLAVANEANTWKTPDGGFDVSRMQGCIMINPGKDINIFADLNGNGEVEPISVPNSYFNLPKYKRNYKGLEFTLEKAFDENWYANVSYVLSEGKGNIEGYVNSTLGQEDPGATQDFDHKRFQDGSYGNLPNDSRHHLKVYGAYQWTDELTITSNVAIRSGTPLSCNGYIPLKDLKQGDGSTTYDGPNFKRYGASSFYCSDGKEGQVLTNRGDWGRTPWTMKFNMGLNYIPTWADDKLTLKLDVFNVLNANKGIQYNQTLDYAKGSALINPNFLEVTKTQAPRSIRLTARYKF